MTQKVAFVTDPLNLSTPAAATTLALMRTAQELGLEVYWMEASDLHIQNNRPVASLSSFRFLGNNPNEYVMGPSFVAQLDDLDQVWWRKHAPYNNADFVALDILQMVDDSTLLYNEPGTIRGLNEALFALQFNEWTPESLVTRNPLAIRAFLAEHGPEALARPLDGDSSHVFLLREGDINLTSLLQELTKDGSQAMLVQKHITAESIKRLFLFNGELLEAVEQTSDEAHPLPTMEQGAQASVTQLNSQELELVAAIGPVLRERGVYLATVDVVADLIVGMNVTCPAGFEVLATEESNLLTQVFQAD